MEAITQKERLLLINQWDMSTFTLMEEKSNLDVLNQITVSIFYYMSAGNIFSLLEFLFDVDIFKYH